MAPSETYEMVATEDPDVERYKDGLGLGNGVDFGRADVSHPSAHREEMLAVQDLDPVLNAKMHRVNDAIDEIGWTNYHSKLFVLNGFGYAVDSLLLSLQAMTMRQAALEFRPRFPNALALSTNTGLLLGALFWGCTADAIGRRTAFNLSLLLCAGFALLAALSPSWVVLNVLVALSASGAGGNLIMDTTVFLEYLPSGEQWLLTLMAGWWGVGDALGGLMGWPFMGEFNNMGWRYVWCTAGFMVLVMSILRVTIVRLRETPKFLLSQGQDAEVIETLHWIARTHNRPCALTLADLSACGAPASSTRALSFQAQLRVHLRGLFASRVLARTTLLLWLSWSLVGLAYSLYYVFLPDYLAARAAALGMYDQNVKWRDYTLIHVASVGGPVLGGFMCNWHRLGRRGTMMLGALFTWVFLLAYTRVRTEAQVLSVNCIISFCMNIYFGCLYAYTPEVLPVAHRATGNGIAVACDRIMGIVSALVAAAADTATVLPMYICAALFLALVAASGAFPLEPLGRRRP